MADAHYSIETVWPKNLNESVCAMANVSVGACRLDNVSMAMSQLAGENSHSTHEQVQRIDWHEAKAADPQAAALVRRLGEELGYRYDIRARHHDRD